MRLNDDGKTVRAMDVLFPGIGEIVGGSQREERYDVLVEKMKSLNIEEKELWWYLDLRKYGTAVHSGFGLGFERLVQFATGMSNIRDVFLAQIFDEDLFNPHRLRLSPSRLDLAALAEICGKSHHLAIIGFSEPLGDYRGIQTS